MATTPQRSGSDMQNSIPSLDPSAAMSVVMKYVPSGRYTSNPISASPEASRSRFARRSEASSA
jgi:hypothetical protein